VEVRPRAHWPEEWAFPEVSVTLKALNVDECRAISWNGVLTFSQKCRAQGWAIFERSDYMDLKKDGWIFPDSTVRFHLAVTGGSLGNAKRKRQEADHGERMWREMKFTDMVLCAREGGAELPCHRVVLAMGSPVFERMLANSMKEGEERRCVIRNVSFETLQFLLEYIYTKCLPETASLNLQYLRELLVLADQYDVKEMLPECASGLAEIMSPANACEVLRLLGRYRSHPDVVEHFLLAKQKAKSDDTVFDALVDGWVDTTMLGLG